MAHRFGHNRASVPFPMHAIAQVVEHVRVEHDGRDEHHATISARPRPTLDPRLHHAFPHLPVRKKPVADDNVDELTRQGQKPATISHPSRGWVGGGWGVARRVAKKWPLVAFGGLCRGPKSVKNGPSRRQFGNLARKNLP
jgi:hypothetical protein